MGKTIFADSEILMFARYEMSDVMLSSETPDFDEAPFKGPWESASDGHDFPVASSEPPAQAQRIVLADAPLDVPPKVAVQHFLFAKVEDEPFVLRGTKVEARPLKLPITREVFTAGTNEERQNSL